MLDLVVSPAARTDLFGIWEYIASDNLEAADRFVLAASKAFTDLARVPGLGRERRFSMTVNAGLRSWRVKGFSHYLVFYRSTPACLEIVRVLNGVQNLDVLLGDKQDS